MTKRNIRSQKDIEPNDKNLSYKSWTADHTRDELTLQLFITKSTQLDGNTLTVLTVNQYQKLAESVLYRTDLCKPAPEFLINESDLTSRLRNELERLRKSSQKMFDKIVADSVQTILESVDKQYHHVSGIPYKVRWRFVQQR
jgi:hypothetical protein